MDLKFFFQLLGELTFEVAKQRAENAELKARLAALEKKPEAKAP